MTPSDFTIKQNVLRGKEVSYPDDGTSFGELILSSMENNLDLVGQIDAVTGEEYTFGKMRERSVRCALWMKSQGLNRRDVVALCSSNHLDLAMPCFAALYLGAVVSPWDTTLNADGLRHQMNITKPKMVFASGDAVAAVTEAAKKAGLGLKIVVFDRAPAAGLYDFESIIAEAGVDQVRNFRCVSIASSSETALIMFSSGTTGLSKGVTLSHRALNMQFRQSKFFGMVGNVCLGFTFISWLSGMLSILWSVLLNIPRFIVQRFEEHLACATIQKYKVTWLLVSPIMISRLIKSDAVGQYDLSSLSKVIHTGASLSSATHGALEELLPQAEILCGYGITELGGYLSLQTRKSQLGSCGQIMENVQLKVIHPDTEKTLGVKQRGEILMKSAAMMTSYYNNPQDTVLAIDKEGWLHSGDLGYYDEDGEIFVIDRLKDVIRLADYDVAPSEIENVILSHSGVKEVAVVGQPLPDGDELPIAFVVRVENFPGTSTQVMEKEIINLVAAELPDSIKQLGAGVRFVEYLPRTPSNKVRRTALRELARSMVTF